MQSTVVRCTLYDSHKCLRIDKVTRLVHTEEKYEVNDECTGRKSANLLEAVSKAAMTGVTVVVRVCATISVFIALLAFADRTLEWFGDQAGLEDFTISVSLSLDLIRRLLPVISAILVFELVHVEVLLSCPLFQRDIVQGTFCTPNPSKEHV